LLFLKVGSLFPTEQGCKRNAIPEADAVRWLVPVAGIKPAARGLGISAVVY
jgi:hypothetical protein